MKKQLWYADSVWKVKLFHTVWKPFYWLFQLVFKRQIIVTLRTVRDDFESTSNKYYDTYDYIRWRLLDFLAEEVKKNLPAHHYAIAELGVFRGDFAAKIESAFPNTPFYLFDTFEGFNDQDVHKDMNMGLSEKAFKDGHFDSTSVDLVLSKMNNKANIHICQGYFPSSITDENKNTQWGFVSLDADLYNPTFEGIKFFYPRLLPGGMILIHDYNNPLFKGVKKAVYDYEENFGIVPKVPIPDSTGSLVIVKPMNKPK